MSQEQSYNRYANPNYVEKLTKLYSWYKGEIPNPFKIAIIPTNRCNLKCFFCPNSVARSSGRFKIEKELKKEEWMKVVEEGLKMDVREWRFLGGGEPLLRYDTVIDMIKRIKSTPNTDCEIITNGTLFKKEDIDDLIKLRFDRIIFSIHGSKQTHHNFLTGSENSFQEVTKNLLTFKKIKKKRKTDKPAIQINTVLTNKNYKDAVHMIKYAKKVGCDELALHPMRLYEEIKKQAQFLKMNEEENKITSELLEKVKRSAEKNKLKLDIAMLESENLVLDGSGWEEPRFKQSFLRMRCFEPWYGMLIDPEGFVTHCVPHGMGNNKLNVKKMSIKNIWLSRYFQAIRKKILNDITMKCCLKCGLLDMSEELRTDFDLFVKVKSD